MGEGSADWSGIGFPIQHVGKKSFVPLNHHIPVKPVLRSGLSSPPEILTEVGVLKESHHLPG